MRKEMISRGPIERKIFMIRGHKVMLDADLAELYSVSTKRLNQQIGRNLERFPADFMFQLTAEESSALRLQIATSKKGRGGRRYTPYAFTEHGAIMAANVLNTKRAIEMSVFVVRAFIRLREILLAHKDLARRLDKLERKYDARFRRVFDAIRELMAPPPAPPPDAELRKRIGFVKERMWRYIACVRKNRVRGSYKIAREERVLV